jgi:uncharacterized protein YjbJ (UPF0337 family)
LIRYVVLSITPKYVNVSRGCNFPKTSLFEDSCVYLILGMISDRIEEQRIHYTFKSAIGTLRDIHVTLISEVKEVIMDREHVKGAADKAKGTIKDAAGKLLDDKKLQAEGKIDKAKGAAHNVAGDVKDAARDASKETKKD